jgi:hypothetical protein
MMKHKKKAKAKKAKVHKLKTKRKMAKGKKVFKRGGQSGVLVHNTATQMVTVEEDALSKRVTESLQNYKDGNTKAFSSVDEVWQAAESE